MYLAPSLVCMYACMYVCTVCMYVYYACVHMSYVRYRFNATSPLCMSGVLGSANT